MKTILKCVKCGKYTFNAACLCGGNPLTPKPAKFSPEDKYADYRRKAKMQFFREGGML